MPVSFEEAGFAASSSSSAQASPPAKASTGVGGAPSTTPQTPPRRGISFEEASAPVAAGASRGLMDKVGDAAVALGKGALAGYNEIAKQVMLAASTPAIVADAIRSSASGKPTTEIQDEFFKWFVQPVDEGGEMYQLSKDASLAEKGAYSVGSALQFINTAIATAGESAAAEGVPLVEKASEIVRRGMLKGADAVKIPAISAAITASDQAYKETGDKTKAIAAGHLSFLTTVASATPAIAVEGGATTRFATGAAAGGAMGYTGRLGMEATLGKEPNWKPTEEDWTNALIGGGLGVLIGKTSRETVSELKSRDAKGDTGFDEMAAKKPKAAEKVAEHVDESDPDYAKKLRERAKKAQKNPDEMGKKTAEKDTQPGPMKGWIPKMAEAAEGDPEFTHESGEFFIVKGKTAEGETTYDLRSKDGFLHGSVDSEDRIPDLIKEGNWYYEDKSAFVKEQWAKQRGVPIFGRKDGRGVVAAVKQKDGSILYKVAAKDPAGKMQDVGTFRRQDTAFFEAERFLNKNSVPEKVRPKRGKKAPEPTPEQKPIIEEDKVPQPGDPEFVGPVHEFFNDANRRQTIRAMGRVVEVLQNLMRGGSGKVSMPMNFEWRSKHYLNTSWPSAQRSLGEAYTKLHEVLKPVYDVWANNLKIHGPDYRIYAKDFLRYMAESTDHPELKAMLEKMREKTTEELAIYPRETLNRGKDSNPDGYYQPSTHKVFIRANPKDPRHFSTTGVIIHELAHALEFRYIRANPTHPLVKRLYSLRNEALNRARLMRDELGADFPAFYGFYVDPMRGNAVWEFLAEARSNPQFQQFLIASEKWKSPGFKSGPPILSQITKIFQKILGITPRQADLFQQVIAVSEAIQKRQSNKRLADDKAYPLDGHKVAEGVARATNEVAEEVLSNSPFYDSLNDLPGVRVSEGKLREYWRAALQTFYPEGFGPRAKKAAVITARVITELKAKDAQRYGQSLKRREFWNRNIDKVLDFIHGFETGGKFSDPMFNKAAEAYKNWMNDLYQQDRAAGIKYDPENNYITHLFEKPSEVDQYMTRKYGIKWGDPYFMKDRVGKTFKELVDYGKVLEAQGKPNPFKPKYTNVEDIMLARDHASNVAHMQIDMLRSLAREGLAVRIKTGRNGSLLTKRPDGYAEAPRRAPNGEKYWVHDEANAVLHNAFDTKSLWAKEGPVGDAFRGAMAIKNTVVPIRLFGLFHAVHVGAVINNASALTRATKQILMGNVDPRKWASDLVRGVVPLSGTKIFDYLKDRGPSRILQAYWGKLDGSQLSGSEKMLLRYMNEGGLVPGMSAQDRLSAKRTFLDAWQQGKYLKAGFKLPGAIIQSLQDPLFHIWIPDMKIAAFARDAANAMDLDPTLHTDPMKRHAAMRRIAKSIDNRFGEMSYDTLFWNRTVKDLTVLNTLSLGWQLGFIREYGGGAVQIAKAPFTKGSLRDKISRGELDKALFASYYVGLATLYTGVLSYALSGTMPQGLDYFYPRSGEEDKDGKPRRLNTPFFTREFVSIQKHMENEGTMAGLGHLVSNKASGVIGLLRQGIFGVNSLGQEVRDPNAPAFRQLEQTLGALFGEILPISVEAMQDPSATSKESILSVGGFSSAPKYATESKLEGEVKSTFLEFYGQPKTSYDRALYSEDARKLKKLAGKDEDRYQALLDSMEVKYNLTPNELHRLDKATNSTENMYVKMFSRMDWRQQKAILDKHWKDMTEEERDEYLRHSNKDHLRSNYDPPEEK